MTPIASPLFGVNSLSGARIPGGLGASNNVAWLGSAEMIHGGTDQGLAQLATNHAVWLDGTNEEAFATNGESASIQTFETGLQWTEIWEEETDWTDDLVLDIDELTI